MGNKLLIIIAVLCFASAIMEQVLRLFVPNMNMNWFVVYVCELVSCCRWFVYTRSHENSSARTPFWSWIVSSWRINIARFLFCQTIVPKLILIDRISVWFLLPVISGYIKFNKYKFNKYKFLITTL